MKERTATFTEQQTGGWLISLPCGDWWRSDQECAKRELREQAALGVLCIIIPVRSIPYARR